MNKRRRIRFGYSLCMALGCGFLVLLAGCGDKKTKEADKQNSSAEGSDDLLVLNSKLPPEVAKAVTPLLEKEEAWLIKPPAQFTPAQLDREFAGLRWEVAKKLGVHDVEGAISYARASLSLDEAHADRWETLGDLYNLSGELRGTRDAENAYDNAVFLNPKALKPRRKLAAALMMLGRFKEAARQLEFCLYLAEGKEQREMSPLYVAACAAAGEMKRGAAFFKAWPDAERDNQHRVARAILENANGQPQEALNLLAAVEKSEAQSTELAMYVGTLRKRFEKDRGGQK